MKSLSVEENLALAAKLEAKRASDAAMEAFLAGGGVITQVPAGKSGIVPGSGSMWGRSRKKVAPVEAVPESEVDAEVELLDVELDEELDPGIEFDSSIDIDSNPLDLDSSDPF